VFDFVFSEWWASHQKEEVDWVCLSFLFGICCLGPHIAHRPSKIPKMLHVPEVIFPITFKRYVLIGLGTHFGEIILSKILPIPIKI